MLLCVVQAFSPLVAGSVSRVLAVSIVSPIEMVRTKIQAQSSHALGYAQLKDIVHAAVRNDG